MSWRNRGIVSWRNRGIVSRRSSVCELGPEYVYLFAQGTAAAAAPGIGCGLLPCHHAPDILQMLVHTPLDLEAPSYDTKPVPLLRGRGGEPLRNGRDSAVSGNSRQEVVEQLVRPVGQEIAIPPSPLGPLRQVTPGHEYLPECPCGDEVRPANVRVANQHGRLRLAVYRHEVRKHRHNPLLRLLTLRPIAGEVDAVEVQDQLATRPITDRQHNDFCRRGCREQGCVRVELQVLRPGLRVMEAEEVLHQLVISFHLSKRYRLI